jgi:hypothetical protein
MLIVTFAIATLFFSYKNCILIWEVNFTQETSLV